MRERARNENTRSFSVMHGYKLPIESVHIVSSKRSGGGASQQPHTISYECDSELIWNVAESAVVLIANKKDRDDRYINSLLKERERALVRADTRTEAHLRACTPAINDSCTRSIRDI